MIERRRWVFDTTTLVSRLLVPYGTAARAVDMALARGVLHPFHGIPIVTPAEFIAMPIQAIAPDDRSA